MTKNLGEFKSDMTKNHGELRSLMGKNHRELKSQLVEIGSRISLISWKVVCLNGVSLAYIMYKLASH